jgi:hypothetical protein
MKDLLCKSHEGPVTSLYRDTSALSVFQCTETTIHMTIFPLCGHEFRFQCTKIATEIVKVLMCEARWCISNKLFLDYSYEGSIGAGLSDQSPQHKNGSERPMGALRSAALGVWDSGAIIPTQTLVQCLIEKGCPKYGHSVIH